MGGRVIGLVVVGMVRVRGWKSRSRVGRGRKLLVRRRRTVVLVRVMILREILRTYGVARVWGARSTGPRGVVAAVVVGHHVRLGFIWARRLVTIR